MDVHSQRYTYTRRYRHICMNTRICEYTDIYIHKHGHAGKRISLPKEKDGVFPLEKLNDDIDTS